MTQVQLYRYDLTNGMARQFSLGMTGRQIDAVWHTAIVVHGVEFFFDGGIGISEAVPGTTRFGTPVVIDDLGTTSYSLHDFRMFNAQLQAERFGPNQYDLLRRNCNHYSAEAAVHLTGRSIPAEVSGMIGELLSTPLGQMMRPNLEMMSRNPNVNAPDPVVSAGSPAPSNTGPIEILISDEDATDDDVERIQALLVVISCHDDSKQRDTALTTLKRIVDNILSNPREAKFRKLSRSGVTYREKLGVVDGAEDFLLGLGFTVRGNDVVLNTAKVNLFELSTIFLSEALETNSESDGHNRSEKEPISSLQWVPLLNGEALPLHALKAGHESDESVPLYVARVGNNVGKFGHHLGGAAVCQNGREVNCSEFEVLCCEEKDCVWVPSSFLGSTRDTLDTFAVGSSDKWIVRAALGGGIHPGFLENNQDSMDARCPFGGSATSVDDWELLCERAKVPASLLDALSHSTELETLYDSWKSRTCRPFHTVSSFLDSEPATRDAIPIISRKSQSPDKKALQLVLCHDHLGGYAPVDQISANGGPNDDFNLSEKCYTVSHWEEVDSFIYFSHALVSIPPEEWIRSAHARGTRVLGTFIVEHSQQQMLVDLLSNSSQVSRLVAQLAKFMVAYSFDGFLLNIEAPVPVPLVPTLVQFVSDLTSNCHLSNVNSQVLWYDAVTIDGEVRYQNGLTQKNEAFFAACDGVFTNYWWNPMNVQFSAFTAGERKLDVFMGIDVYGRKTFGGGGFGSHTAIEEIQKAGVSCAMFAPAWTAAKARTRREFEENEAKLWGPMLPILSSHGQGPVIFLSQQYPSFSSRFCSGYGRIFADGSLTRCCNSWAQISLQQPSPANVTNSPNAHWSTDGALRLSDRCLEINAAVDCFPLFGFDLEAGQHYVIEVEVEGELSLRLQSRDGQRQHNIEVQPQQDGNRWIYGTVCMESANMTGGTEVWDLIVSTPKSQSVKIYGFYATRGNHSLNEIRGGGKKEINVEVSRRKNSAVAIVSCESTDSLPLAVFVKKRSTQQKLFIGVMYEAKWIFTVDMCQPSDLFDFEGFKW